MTEIYVIGKSTHSINGLDIVTGKAMYTADLFFPGTLVGKLLYPSYPCARIKKIDVDKAKRLPGVLAVLTSEDVPGENSYLVYESDQPLLAKDYVRYQGDILAAIAAKDEASEIKKKLEEAGATIEVQ